MLAVVSKYLLSGLGNVGNTVKRRFLFTIIVIQVILLTWFESVPGLPTVIKVSVVFSCPPSKWREVPQLDHDRLLLYAFRSGHSMLYSELLTVLLN
jgi:hypothetical protein